MLRRTIGDVLLILLVAAAILVFVGQITGQPLLLAYVETGSMEPAIDSGDGFIAVPAALMSEPSEGDVIIYDAEEIQGGGLTTHRVIRVTEEGYETKGDANPFSDQDGDEPYVTDDQVVAGAVQMGDTVITIPHLGTGISWVQGLITGAVSAITSVVGFGDDVTPQRIGLGFIVVSILLLLSGFGSDAGPSRSRDRQRSDSDEQYDTRIIAIMLLILILVPANAAMVLPDNKTDFTIDGEAVADAEGVSAGDEISSEITASNDGLIALLVVSKPVDSDVRLQRQAVSVSAGGSTKTQAQIRAPPADGSRTITIQQHRYLLLLPDSVLLSLHEVSPYLALGVLNGLIGAAVLGAVGGLLGFGKVRDRDTSRPSSLWRTLERRLPG